MIHFTFLLKLAEFLNPLFALIISCYFRKCSVIRDTQNPIMAIVGLNSCKYMIKSLTVYIFLTKSTRSR